MWLCTNLRFADSMWDFSFSFIIKTKVAWGSTLKNSVNSMRLVLEFTDNIIPSLYLPQCLPVRLQLCSWIRHWFQYGSESRDTMSKNFSMKTKFIYFFKKLQYNYPSLGLQEGRSNYRRSLQPSKENIQHLKNNRFLHFFSDPDPCVLNADQDPAD